MPRQVNAPLLLARKFYRGITVYGDVEWQRSDEDSSNRPLDRPRDRCPAHGPWRGPAGIVSLPQSSQNRGGSIAIVRGHVLVELLRGIDGGGA
eukprot:7007617-Pyramimonas_sp.AAC.1